MKTKIYEANYSYMKYGELGLFECTHDLSSMLINVINESCIICASFCRNNRLILNMNEHTNIVDGIFLSFFLSHSLCLLGFLLPNPSPTCDREHFRLQQAWQLPDTVVVASRPQIPRAEDVK